MCRALYVDEKNVRGWGRIVEIACDDQDSNIHAQAWIKVNGRGEWMKFKKWLRSLVDAREALSVADQALGNDGCEDIGLKDTSWKLHALALAASDLMVWWPDYKGDTSRATAGQWKTAARIIAQQRAASDDTVLEVPPGVLPHREGRP